MLLCCLRIIGLCLLIVIVMAAYGDRGFVGGLDVNGMLGLFWVPIK